MARCKNDFLCTLPILLNTKQSHAKSPQIPTKFWTVIQKLPFITSHFPINNLSSTNTLWFVQPLLDNTSQNTYLCNPITQLHVCESTLRGIQDLIWWGFIPICWLKWHKKMTTTKQKHTHWEKPDSLNRTNTVVVACEQTLCLGKK